jgi:formyl-CoA transferase
VRYRGASAPEALLQDERFSNFTHRSRNIDHVYHTLMGIFEERTTAEWMRILEEADIPMMPMHDLLSVMQDPHLVATGFFQTAEHPSEGTIRSMRNPVTWSATPPAPPRLAPVRGEHSTEVLREAGYTAAEIEALLASGAVQAATTRKEA